MATREVSSRAQYKLDSFVLNLQNIKDIFNPTKGIINASKGFFLDKGINDLKNYLPLNLPRFFKRSYTSTNFPYFYTDPINNIEYRYADVNIQDKYVNLEFRFYSDLMISEIHPEGKMHLELKSYTSPVINEVAEKLAREYDIVVGEYTFIGRRYISDLSTLAKEITNIKSCQKDFSKIIRKKIENEVATLENQVNQLLVSRNPSQ